MTQVTMNEATTVALPTEFPVPDLGTSDQVDVIEVHASVGDHIEADAPIVTLEGDKATMDVPAPQAGTLQALHIKVGDKVATGDAFITLLLDAGTATAVAASTSAAPAKPAPQKTAPAKRAATATASQGAPLAQPNSFIYAGPSMRQFARELGVDLSRVQGTGRKNRITRDDITAFVKYAMQQGTGGPGLSIEPAPDVDFSKFGPVETKALNKIKRLTAKNLHRNWVTIPHVTQFDQADITAMDAYRKANKAKAKEQGINLTPLAFIMKAVVVVLKEYPQFNASLDSSGENLILKQYYHIGVAADTPNGLVVPVIRDCDKKSLLDIAKELGTISAKAREKGLTPAEMSGSCFTISSLGGIGGTAFTPIINAPDVAILGVSKAGMQPVYEDGEFKPHLMLPLSLSYDHRVIDGAEAARFCRCLADALADIESLV